MSPKILPTDSISAIKIRIIDKLHVEASDSDSSLDFRLFHGDRSLDDITLSVSEYNADDTVEENIEAGTMLRLEYPLFWDQISYDYEFLHIPPKILSCVPMPQFQPRLQVNFDFSRSIWSSTVLFQNIRDGVYSNQPISKRQCLQCRAFVERNIILPKGALCVPGYVQFVERLRDEYDFLRFLLLSLAAFRHPRRGRS